MHLLNFEYPQTVFFFLGLMTLCFGASKNFSNRQDRLSLPFIAFCITNALGSEVHIGSEQLWDSLDYCRRYGSSWSRSSNFCFYEEGMFSVCMLAKKESKERHYSWGLFQWQSFTLADVYVYAHMWLHSAHSGKNIEPEVRRHACKPLFFFGSVSHLQNEK